LRPLFRGALLAQLPQAHTLGLPFPFLPALPTALASSLQLLGDLHVNVNLNPPARPALAKGSSLAHTRALLYASYMLYAFAQLVEIPAALDFVVENCWEFLKSRPTSLNLAESAPPSLQSADRLPACLLACPRSRIPAPPYCISTAQSSSSKKLATLRATHCPGRWQRLRLNLDSCGPGNLPPPYCQFAEPSTTAQKRLLYGGRDTTSPLSVCNDDTNTAWWGL